MVLTGVQIRDDDQLRASVIHGEPRAVLQGRNGPIALFSPGALVVYLVELPRVTRLFVFRASVQIEHATVLPGVTPEVNLLLGTHTKGAAAKVRNLLLWLSKNGYEPRGLSDAFWLRASNVLSGRRPLGGPVLPSLLAREAG